MIPTIPSKFNTKIFFLNIYHLHTNSLKEFENQELKSTPPNLSLVCNMVSIFLQ